MADRFGTVRLHFANRPQAPLGRTPGAFTGASLETPGIAGIGSQTVSPGKRTSSSGLLAVRSINTGFFAAVIPRTCPPGRRVNGTEPPVAGCLSRTMRLESAPACAGVIDRIAKTSAVDSTSASRGFSRFSPSPDQFHSTKLDSSRKIRRRYQGLPEDFVPEGNVPDSACEHAFPANHLPRQLGRGSYDSPHASRKEFCRTHLWFGRSRSDRATDDL